MAHRPPGGAHGFVSIGILWRAFMFIVSNIVLEVSTFVPSSRCMCHSNEGDVSAENNNGAYSLFVVCPRSRFSHSRRRTLEVAPIAFHRGIHTDWALRNLNFNSTY